MFDTQSGGTLTAVCWAAVIVVAVGFFVSLRYLNERAELMGWWASVCHACSMTGAWIDDWFVENHDVILWDVDLYRLAAFLMVVGGFFLGLAAFIISARVASVRHRAGTLLVIAWIAYFAQVLYFSVGRFLGY